MSRPDIRLVCFDLGGVLVQVVSSWEEACHRCGLTIPASAVAWDKHHTLMQQYERGRLTSDEYFAAVSQLLNGFTVDQFQKAFDAWLGDVYPGAYELIDDLKSRGVRTACLSNTNARHWQTLSETNPTYAGLKRLDHLFVSQELGEAKPDPAIYLAAQNRINLPPDQILFFDDKPENVAGARAVGWHAEHVHAPDRVAQQRQFLQQYGVL
jgi:HAD superfamily hydrolase (TIGR01509 family)